MKRIFPLLFAGLLLGSYACSDKDDTADPAATENTVFIANGVTDVTLSENGITYLAVLVELKNTVQEQVHISVSNLPANVTCTVSPENGTPTFTASLAFKATKAAIGEYPAKITVTSLSGVAKTYDFKIKVIQTANSITRLTGNYRLSANACDTVTRTKVTRDQFALNKIFFQKLVKGKDIYGIVDTVAKTINIPSQIVEAGLSAYEGTASYSGNTINLNSIMRHNGGGSTGIPCPTTLTKY